MGLCRRGSVPRPPSLLLDACLHLCVTRSEEERKLLLRQTGNDWNASEWSFMYVEVIGIWQHVTKLPELLGPFSITKPKVKLQ